MLEEPSLVTMGATTRKFSLALRAPRIMLNHESTLLIPQLVTE